MGLFAVFKGCISHCVTGDRRCHRHKQPDICLSCSGNWMKKKSYDDVHADDDDVNADDDDVDADEERGVVR